MNNTSRRQKKYAYKEVPLGEELYFRSSVTLITEFGAKLTQVVWSRCLQVPEVPRACRLFSVGVAWQLIPVAGGQKGHTERPDRTGGSRLVAAG